MSQNSLPIYYYTGKNTYFDTISKITAELGLKYWFVQSPHQDKKATEELKNLESLTPPTEKPAQVIKPPLELPEEATPPATP